MPKKSKPKGLRRNSRTRPKTLLFLLRENDMIGFGFAVDWIAYQSKPKKSKSCPFFDRYEIAARYLVDRLASMKSVDCEAIVRGSEGKEDPLKPIVGGVWPMIAVSDAEEQLPGKYWRLVCECEYQPGRGTIYNCSDPYESYHQLEIHSEFIMKNWPPLDRRHYSKTKQFLSNKVQQHINRILSLKPKDLDDLTIAEATLLLTDEFPDFPVHPMIEQFKNTVPQRAKRGRLRLNSQRKRIFEEFRNELRIPKLKK